MKHSRITGLYFFLIILVMMASSCASNRPPYRQHKPRKPAGCDCSRWSYHIPANSLVPGTYEKKLTGRA